MVVALATETQEHTPRRWSHDGELDVIAIAGLSAFVPGWECAL
jgi:hypothetical protein